jgi:hypothetical protein
MKLARDGQQLGASKAGASWRRFAFSSPDGRDAGAGHRARPGIFARARRLVMLEPVASTQFMCGGSNLVITSYCRIRAPDVRDCLRRRRFSSRCWTVTDAGSFTNTGRTAFVRYDSRGRPSAGK